MRARLSWAIGLVALLGAGFYVFVYLYRWEWNRAITAGVLFIATEIALATALILERLKTIETKLDDASSKAGPSAQALEAIEDAAPPRRRHFAWLSDQDKVGVFVPVLMGAGMVISGIAWAVERVAASTAKPLLERRLAARLAPLSLPAGGLTGTLPAPPAIPRASFKNALRRLFLVLCVGAGLAMAVDQLGDLTQNRPDALTTGQTTVALEISIRDEDLGTTAAAARSLWMACRGTVSSDLQRLTVHNGTASLTLTPALGPYSMKRLNGCFEDGTIDGLSAHVVER